MDETTGNDISLSIKKLVYQDFSKENKVQAVLVENGSFNPPTYMHLRMFDLGKEALISRGYHFLGGYMSPVNDAYKKHGLVSSQHRIAMCQLAIEDSEFIMVDSWEALQPTYQRTLNVLNRISSLLCRTESVNCGLLRVFLLCGADLLESFMRPGVWIPDQIEAICRDHGIVCIRRGGLDITKLISESDLLSKYKEHIIVINDFDCDISSSKVRENLCTGVSVDSLIPTDVVNYIKSQNLYQSSMGTGTGIEFKSMT